MRKLFIGIIILTALIGMIIVIIISIRTSGTKIINVATFSVTSLTFIALIFYANDTNRLAHIAQNKWENESIINVIYEMQTNKDDPGTDQIIFKLLNRSNMVIRAKVWAVLKVYGKEVNPGDPYNGTNTWVLFPQEFLQGWYSLQNLLSQVGKTIEQMRSEYKPENKFLQLTCDLTIEFRGENKTIRKLPTRRYYYLFEQSTWIPDLSRKDDDLWEDG